MDGIWYFRRLGELKGPIQFHELIEAAENGAFDANDEVRSGHSGWRPARTVPELSVALGVPVEEVSDEIDVAISEPEDLPNIDDFFNEAGSHHSTEPIRQESQAQQLEAETGYYCRIDGKEQGPFNLERLQTLLESGTIQVHERVRRSNTAAWIPCSEISELDFDRASRIRNRISDPDETIDDDNFDPNLLEQFEDFDPLDSILKEDEEESSPLSDPASRMTAVSPLPARSSEPLNRQPSETRSDPVRTPPAPEPELMRSILEPLQAMSEPEIKPASSRGVALPKMSASTGQLIFLGLAAVFFVSWYAFPGGKSGVYGSVKMGVQPLPVGTVSLNSGSNEKNSAMTISIFDGEFDAGEGRSLRPERYEVIVTIGNPLGMQVPQLAGTAFEKLNGARYRTELNGATIESGPIEINFSESSVELLEGNGELPESGATE